MGELSIPSLAEPVSVFPLPNVVLFPRAVLPLHIFEDRYRLMIREALAGDPLVAMALLCPGYQEKYYTNVARIYPVVCVGQILSHEKLDDGRYNILLQGLCRARVRQERPEGQYRRAMLQAMLSREPPEKTQRQALRQKLRQAIASPPFARISVARKLQDLMAMDLTLGEVADLVAYAMVQEIQVKQDLLEQLDVAQRVEQLLTEIQTLGRIVDLTRRHRAEWPPQQGTN